MALTMARPWKHPKTGVYWLRKRVPDGLRQAVGVSEYKRSLKTKDPAEAKRNHAVMLAELEAEWASLRQPESPPAALPPVAPAAENGRIIPTADSHAGALFWLPLIGKVKVPEETDEPLSPSEEGRRLLLKIAATETEKARLFLQRANATNSAAAAAGPTPARRSVSFDTLLKGWEAERKPLPKTSYEYQRVIRDLRAFLGHDDAAQLTSDDVVRWKAHLIEAKLHPKTIKDAKLAPLRAVLQWGADNNYLQDNPAQRVTIEVKRRAGEGKRGFSDEEAALILKAASSQPDVAKRWIPLLGAYSGARIAELAQLRAEDILPMAGIVCMKITPEAGPLKTLSSERIVPLHPTVIDAGFVEFAQSVGKGPLFPSMKPNVFGSRGGNATKIIGRWVRGLGIVDPRLSPSHSWRHRFKTLARQHGLAPDVSNAITGHSAISVADRYGEFTVDALYREISKIPHVQIASHLYPANTPEGPCRV